MRAFAIVDLAPIIENFLCLIEGREGSSVQHFSRERAIKALILALGLGMIGPAMDKLDPEVEQPYPEAGVSLCVMESAPGWPIIGQDAQGQTITPEHMLEPGLDGFSTFIRARSDLQRIARMIIEQCQRMAAVWAEGEMTFEVHLPQLVGSSIFEASPVSLAAGSRSIQAIMATQDLRDRGS